MRVTELDREKWNKRYRGGAYAERLHPSAILEHWIDSIPVGRAMDVACGAGRNTLYLAQRGFKVDAIDISGEALERARTAAAQMHLDVNWLEHDLDEKLELDTSYQLILIVRYVNLPLVRQMATNLAPGGFLVCEQHLLTAADVIGPTNPAFRVSPGDLVAAAEGLHVQHLEETLVTEPDGSAAALARLVAQRH
jgi:tellurite methyltransferase